MTEVPSAQEIATRSAPLTRSSGTRGARARWYLHRLLSMSPPEITHRAAEHAKKRIAKWTPAGWRAFACDGEGLPGLPRPRGPDAIDAEAKSVLRRFASEVMSEGAPVLGRRAPPGADRLRWHRDPVSGRPWPSERFTFDIAYRHDTERGDVKYVWELNRLQHLQPIAVLAGIENDAALKRFCLAEIESWIDANPPFRGVNWASGIELALRAVSMLVVLSFCADDIVSPALRRKVRSALAAHAYWLARFPSRFSSANNHLIAEAGGMFLIGTLAPDLPGARRLADKGRRILEREASRQFHADGVGAEQSPTYTAFTLEWYLLAALVGDAAGRPLSEAVRTRLALAGEPLRAMMDRNGHVPRIGDDDEGRVIVTPVAYEEGYVASVLGALAAMTGATQIAPPRPRRDLRSFFFGHPQAGAAMENGIRSFDAGGYSVVRETAAGREVVLTFDHGPLGHLSIAAHGHADALAIWLHVDGRPVLVDAGTYLYGSGGGVRDGFRSTAAHNTLTIGGASSSIPAGPFNWRQKAGAWREPSGTRELRGRHDGYLARFGVIHERRLTWDETTITIEDRLLGRLEPGLLPEAGFLIHPDLTVRLVDRAVLVSHEDRPLIRMRAAEGISVRIAKGELEPLRGWYSPRFGSMLPAAQVLFAPPAAYRVEGLVTAIEILPSGA